jgi:hypothetical protein
MPTLTGGILGVTGLIAKGINPTANVSQDLQVWGLSHLVAATVSGFVNGEDIGDVTVAADGSVTIDISSTSHAVTAATIVTGDGDWGESTTPVYIQNGSTAVWVDAAIVIGSPIVAQGQRLRPATADDVGSRTGPALGMTRRSQRAAVLVENAVIVKFGTLLDPSPSGNMDQAIFPGADGVTPATQPYAMFSGVHLVLLEEGYSYDSQFCWQIDRPWPCTVLAISQFLHAEEDA